MEPAFREGDRLLVFCWGRRPRVGDVVVAHNPEPGPPLVLKRVSTIVPGLRGATRYALLGDNDAASRDSRHFGPVPAEAIVGRVVWRYDSAADEAPDRT
jgi:hypothetical protein